MSARLTKAILTISIDMDAPDAATQLVAHRQRDAILQRLLAMFSERRLPATWCASDPLSATTLDIGTTHELALAVGDESSARGTLARELVQRLSSLKFQGLAVNTLVARSQSVVEHLDVVSGHGIVAVRHAAGMGVGKSSNRMQPSLLRFGVWGFPVSCELPGRSRWLPGGGRHAARRQIDRAIAERGLVQLVIDAPRLAARGRSAERALASLLADVDQRRRQGVLEIATIGATAARLAGQQESRPSRSILRPAA
ncbi:MAG: hypothetical protein WD845_15025 [Pirellulales bacterium]